MHNGLLSLSVWPTWTLIARIYSSKAWLSGDKAWLTQAAVFLPTHLAFIRTESFFRAAELIGLRFAVWTNIGLLFAAPTLRLCFAHQAFFAPPILARAAVLM